MLRWLFGRTFKKILKDAAVEEEDFDEFQSSLQSMYKNMDDLEDLMEKGDKQRAALVEKNRKKKKK